MKAPRCPAGESGTILLAALLMLSALMGVTLLCSLLNGGDRGNARRRLVTLQRMQMVKEALVGNLAVVGGRSSGQVLQCGGFISDYGEPDLFRPFGPETDFMGVLLNAQSVPTWGKWTHDGACQFWAGYRGERYLAPPPDAEDDAPPFPQTFADGWGHPLQVLFGSDTSGEQTVLRIVSLGSDGLAGGSGGYREDIEDRFYWKRSLNLTLGLDLSDGGLPEGTILDVQVTLLYPFHGDVRAESQTLSVSLSGGLGTGVCSFPANPPLDMSPVRFPVGLRRLEVILLSDLSSWGGPESGALLADRGLLLPPAAAVAEPPGPPGAFELTLEWTP
jgi:hypothetical protein